MSSEQVPPVLVPVLSQFALALEPGLIHIMINMAFVSMLIPLLGGIFYFSTAKSRRSPLFISLVLAIVLSGISGVWILCMSIRGILYPFKNMPPWTTVAVGTWQAVTLTVIDVVLLFRLLAVYPPSTTPRLKLVAIVIPPVLLKIARLTAWGITSAQYLRRLRGVPTVNAAADKTLQSLLAGQAVAWIAGTVDNAFASMLFLWKVRGSLSRNPDSGRLTGYAHDSITGRIRTLFWMATTNFVFPVIINVIQIVLSFRGHANSGAYLQAISIYISVLCATLASVWSSSHWNSIKRQPFEFGTTHHGQTTGIAIRPFPPDRKPSAVIINGTENPTHQQEGKHWAGKRQIERSTSSIPLAVHVEEKVTVAHAV